MRKNAIRHLFLSLSFLCAVQNSPIQAFGLATIAHAFQTSVCRGAKACGRISRPVAILAAVAAVGVGTLLLYNRWRSNQPTLVPSPMLARIWNWFKPQQRQVAPSSNQPAVVQLPVAEITLNASPISASIAPAQVALTPAITAVQEQAPSAAPISSANTVLQQQDPAVNEGVAQVAIPLAERITVPVEGYVPANDNELAIVPYFNYPENLVGSFQFVNQNDGATVTVQQVRTFNQFGDPNVNGSGQTCGLHAAKNFCGLAGLVRGLNSGSMLTGRDEALHLFGSNPQGVWRGHVDINRKKRALKELLEDRLERRDPVAIPTDPIDVGIYIIRPSLNRFISGMVDIVEHEGEATITGQQVADYLSRANPLYTAFLQDQNNLARYLRIENPIHITRDDLQSAIRNYNNSDIWAQQMFTDSECLSMDEINELVDSERINHESVISCSSGDIPLIPCPYIARDALEQNGVLRNLRNAIQARQLPAQRTVAFIPAAGHWRIVMAEFAQRHRRYTIAESADNAVRLARSDEANIISFLEGVPIDRMNSVQ